MLRGICFFRPSLCVWTRAGVAAGFEDYGLTLVVWMSASLVSFKLQSWELKKKSDFLIQD